MVRCRWNSRKSTRVNGNLVSQADQRITLQHKKPDPMPRDGVAETVPSPRGAGDKRVSGPKPNPWHSTHTHEDPCMEATAHDAATSPHALFPPPPAVSAPPSSAAPRERTRTSRAAEQRGATSLINPGKKTPADKPCDDYKAKHHPLPALQQFCATPLGHFVANNAISLYSLLIMDTVIECSGGTPEADHLCVLVHGVSSICPVFCVVPMRGSIRLGSLQIRWRV